MATRSLIDVLDPLEPHLDGPSLGALGRASREYNACVRALQPPGPPPSRAWGELVSQARHDEPWLRWALEHHAPIGDALTHSPPPLPPALRAVARQQHELQRLVDVGDAAGLRDALERTRFNLVNAALDAEGATLLLVAITRGDIACARVLLQAGADPDARGPRDLTPLMVAAALRKRDGGSGGMVAALLHHTRRRGSLEARDRESGWTALLFAAQCGHEAAVQELLGAGADVHARSPLGHTALTLAAQGAHVGTASALLRAGAAVDVRDADGYTPLMWAACQGESRLVQELRKAGADLERRDEEGCTPLWVAARLGDTRCVSGLLHEGASPDARMPGGQTALMVAANAGCVHALVAHGAAVDALGPGQRTALAFAAADGRDGAVQQLLAHGAQTEARDENGCTPLIHAANAACVHALANAGAAVDAVDETGSSALMWAALAGEPERVHALLERGANPNARDAGDRSALMAASDRECARLLLAYGADVSHVDLEGRGALGWASLHGHDEVVRVLLEEAPARADARDHSGATALMLAANERCVRELLPCSQVDARDEQGRTALSWAASRNDARSVEQLLRAGAEVDARDKDGLTALAWAVAAGGRRDDAAGAVRVLLQWGAQSTPSEAQPV